MHNLFRSLTLYIELPEGREKRKIDYRQLSGVSPKIKAACSKGVPNIINLLKKGFQIEIHLKLKAATGQLPKL